MAEVYGIPHLSSNALTQQKVRLISCLTAPYSEERRRAASEAAKKSGVHRKDAGR